MFTIVSNRAELSLLSLSPGRWTRRRPRFSTPMTRRRIFLLACSYGACCTRESYAGKNIGGLSASIPFPKCPGFLPTRWSSSKQHPARQKRWFSKDGDDDDSRRSTEAQQPMSAEYLANQLKTFRYSKIVALVGAGASCSAGIPDFRTPGTGLYDQLSAYNLPFPEAIFDLAYYQQNPIPFVELSAAIWPGQSDGPRPTLAHSFLRLLEDKNLLQRIYTQNIDGLEGLAGISTDKLVECHGHFRSSKCTVCKHPMPIEECYAAIQKKSPPKCTQCGSLVKPDIVFFGEEMPSAFSELIDGDLAECDLLLILGTSLMVMPVAGIPSWVSCPRILMNREAAGGITTNTKDLFWQGDCDDSVQDLCKLAGWSEDLQDVVSKLPKPDQ